GGPTALNITWGLRKSPPGPLETLATSCVLVLTVHLCYGTGFLRGLATRSQACFDQRAVWSEAEPPVAGPHTPALELSPDLA
ncbi:MAG TPA: hypothetical protein VHJ78_09770, partial [Actinomycetota bacterium]|nr:hypothetical protein [Actinomycetota bacterium]